MMIRMEEFHLLSTLISTPKVFVSTCMAGSGGVEQYCSRRSPLDQRMFSRLTPATLLLHWPRLAPLPNIAGCMCLSQSEYYYISSASFTTIIPMIIPSATVKLEGKSFMNAMKLWDVVMKAILEAVSSCNRQSLHMFHTNV